MSMHFVSASEYESSSGPFSYINPSSRYVYKGLIDMWVAKFTLRNTLNNIYCCEERMARQCTDGTYDNKWNMEVGLRSAENIGKLSRKIEKCDIELEHISAAIAHNLESEDLSEYLKFDDDTGLLVIIRDDPDTIYND